MPRKKRKYEEYISLGYSADGKRIRKYIGADSAAEFERLKRAAILEADKVRNPSDISLYDYAVSWAEIYKGKRSIATREMYDYSIKKMKLLKHLPMRDVTPTQLQKIINSNWEHPDACKKLRLALKQIYAQAIRDGIIYPRNLADELTLPPAKEKEIRFFSDDELEKIMSGTYKEQDRLYIDILRSTGMRPSEALALQWTDIGDDQITVRRSFEFKGNDPRIKTTKTNRIRTIPVTSEFAASLHQMPKSGLFIFQCSDGRMVTKSAYSRMSERVLKEINRVLGGTESMKVTEGVTMYTFRHTYATRLYYHAVKPGIISVKQAAAIMGHSEEMFIRRYTHIDNSKEKMSEVAAALFGKKGDQKETRLLKKVAGRPEGDQKNRLKSVKIGKLKRQ